MKTEVKKSTAVDTVDLTRTGLRIAQVSKPIQEKVLAEKEVLLTGAQLKPLSPQLGKLEEIPLIRLYVRTDNESGEQKIDADVISLCYQNDALVLVDATLKPIERFDLVDWRIAYKGSATVLIDGVQVRGNLRVTKGTLGEYTDDPIGSETGCKLEDYYNLLAPIPNPGRKLGSLGQGTSWRVIASEQSVGEAPNGETIESLKLSLESLDTPDTTVDRVWANAELERLIEQSDKPVEFKVLEVRTAKNGNQRVSIESLESLAALEAFTV